MARFLRGRTQFNGRLHSPVSIYPLDAPTQQQQTIVVSCVTHTVRSSAMQRRAPMSGWKLFPPILTPATAVARPIVVSCVTRDYRPIQRRTPFSRLPRLTPPTAEIAVFLASQAARMLAVRRRLRTQLIEPVFYPPLVDEIRSALVKRSQSLARRRPIYGLRPPLVSPAVTFSGPKFIQVAPSVRLFRPLPHSRLSQPVVTTAAQVFSGPEVFCARVPRRVTRYGLAAPKAIEGTLQAPDRRLVISVTLARPARRATHSRLAPTLVDAVAQVFAPIVVELARSRPVRRVRSQLASPTTLLVFSGTRVVPARVPRRFTHSVLRPPQFYPATSSIRAVLAEQPRLGLIRRPARSRLTPPVVLQTFDGPQASLVRTRPQPTGSVLSPPVFYPATSTIRTALTALRPSQERARRAPRSRLSAPVFYEATSTIRVVPASRVRHITRSKLSPPVFYAATSTISVRLAKARRPGVASQLFGPTALQAFDGPSAYLAQTVRRQVTRSRLLAPSVVTAAPFARPIVVSLAAVSGRLVQRRPIWGLGAPLVSPAVVFDGPQVTLARIVPPRTHVKLGKPTVLIAPSVEQAQETIRVTLVRARRRATITRLYGPTALQVFAGPQVYGTSPSRRQARSRLAPPFFYAATSRIGVSLTRLDMRRRGPRSKLAAPTVVEAAALAPAPRIHLAPQPRRRTTSRLVLPTVLQVFSGPQVQLVAASRLARAPRSRLQAPVFYAATSTVRVTTVRTRPRPIHSRLSPPVFYEATSLIRVVLGGADRLTRVRRPARYGLAAPKVVAPPVPTDQQQKITVLLAARTARERRTPFSVLRPPFFYDAISDIQVALVRTPRPLTHSRLFAPADLETYGGPRVALTRARRPLTHSKLAGPVVAATDLARRITTAQVAVSSRVVLRRAISGLRPPLVGPAVVYRAAVPALTGRNPAERVRRRPLFRLEQPVSIFPADEPTLQQQTVLARLIRTRPAQVRSRLRQPVVVGAVAAIATPVRVVLVRTRPPRFTAQLRPPVVLPATSRISVTAVRTRPRPTRYLVAPPTSLETFSGPATATPGLRPGDVRRGTHVRLSPPAVIRDAATRDQQTLLVSLAPARRPQPFSRLAAPVFYAATSTIRTVLAAGRSRVTGVRRLPETRLGPPRVLAYFFGPAVHLTRLARIRLRSLAKLRAHPTGRVFVYPAAIVSLAPARRPLTTWRLRPPTAVTAPPEIRPRPPFVHCVAVADRWGRVRRGPHSVLRPNPPGKHLGVACLIDVPAALGCLTDSAGTLACLEDFLAALACLLDQQATAACLDNQAATLGCLSDAPSALACLVDKLATLGCADDAAAAAPCLDEKPEAEAILEEEEM